MKAPRVVAVLLVLVVRAAVAADFSAGAELYERGDYEAAIDQWRTLANQGDLRAQYRLAQMYAEGVGVRQNDQSALHWYRQAAEQGSIIARFELALMYSLGRGVPHDDSRAAYWYGLLAEDGSLTAQYLLAGMYEEGRGVGKDLHFALHWYRRAADRGHLGAQVKLGEMYSRGGEIEVDLAQAWMWFDVAAAKGNNRAVREREQLGARLDKKALARAMALRRGLSGPTDAGQVESEVQPEPEPEPEPEIEPEPARETGMIRVAAGCFGMGSDPSEAGRHDNEPRHPVCIKEFFISRHEVTRGQYASFVRETGRETPDTCYTYDDGGWRSRTGRSWRYPGYAQNDDHPVTCVSRDDALAYAAWLSQREGRDYRLPTEAEWEHAARAGSGTSRHWGDDPDRACTWGNLGDQSLPRHFTDWSWAVHPCDDGHVYTAPVGSYRVSLYGLHDMLGNVWEWTCSSYDPVYQGGERRCDFEPRSGVVRGGSWSNSPRWVRSAARFENRVGARFDLVGFRLARD